jgi:hypothetical protein
MFDQLKEYRYQKPPYSTRYPELLTLDQGNPAIPAGNRILRNISVGGRWLDVYDANSFDFSVVTMKDNIIADSLICRRLQKDYKGWDPYYLDIDTKDGYVLLTRADSTARREFGDNEFLTSDPGFVDAQRFDFRLKETSPALRLGFKQIPFEKIGLQPDAYRRDLPARAE